MRQAEQRLWDAMRGAAPSGVWLQRIENLVGEGIPDVFMAAQCGVSTWVELKAPPRPKRATTALLGKDGVRLSQINWHLKAASLGLRTFILVRDSERALYLFPGAAAAELGQWSLEVCELKSLADAWPAIFRVLRDEVA
jgi:hypothetical protein